MVVVNPFDTRLSRIVEAEKPGVTNRPEFVLVRC